MKSAERHNLQNNVMAHGLELAIERYRPYIPKIAGGIVAFIVLLFIWSYVSGSSAARKSGAWDAFHQSIGASQPNLERLRQAAEENQGTQMQQLADVTWADSQVLMASGSYIYNRKAANELITRAVSAYEGVLQSNADSSLKSRAHLGLARAYEMQNNLDKARAEYALVTGAYEKYAKAQAERLADPQAKDTYAWLDTAKPPVPISPTGPGVPGKGPAFSPGDLTLPPVGADPTGMPGPGDAKVNAEAVDALFKEMNKEMKDGEKADDRYKSDQPGATETNPATPGTEATPETKTGEATPPADAKEEGKTDAKQDGAADEKKAAK